MTVQVSQATYDTLVAKRAEYDSEIPVMQEVADNNADGVAQLTQMRDDLDLVIADLEVSS